ncbi:MAG TPA: hypothetical protein VFM54_15170, partial [Micromonosporaceae bacterium]|nr:hypothetical protein [Micromonosporaceae bacterium]
MRSSKWTRAAFAGVLAVPLFAVVGAVPAAAQAPGSYDATPLSAQSRVDGPKAPTSRLAKTDRSLLGRTDTAPVSVM